jgi:galactokinase
MPESSAPPAFVALFDGPPEASAHAPGRVNLIGEHTDYHDGFVLPCAIPQRTRVEVRRRRDRRVRAWSTAHPLRIEEFVWGDERRRGDWTDYVAGLTYALRRSGLGVDGFDLRIESDVPVGAGLSSSASLEVAILRALRALFALPLDDVQLARVAQSCEVDFVGAPVGIMDQMAASLANEREALFLDTRSLAFTRIALPSSVDLIVIDSGIAHRHASGGYATRRKESEEAARLLGVTRLRDVPSDALERLSALPPTLARRARHVITENSRVLRAVRALDEGDVVQLGQLFQASHVSMRDDYEVSIAAVDALVDCGRADPDVWGARLTGGGFGGAVVMLARAGRAVRAAARIVRRYRARTGADGRVLVPV